MRKVSNPPDPVLENSHQSRMLSVYCQKRVLKSLFGCFLIITLLEFPPSQVFAYNNYGNPPCFWPYTHGVKKTLNYKWGNAIGNYQLWIAAFNSSVSDWNAAQSKVQYVFNSGASNTFDVYSAQAILTSRTK